MPIVKCTRCPATAQLTRHFRDGQRLYESDSAAKLIATYGCDSVIVARRWAEVAALTGNIARGHNWQRIVDHVERQVGDDALPRLIPASPPS